MEPMLRTDPMKGFCDMDKFDQLVQAFGRLKGGVPWLWFALCVSLIGLVGCLSQTLYLGSLLWVATGTVVATILSRRRQLARQAHDAEIAARADRENLDYLASKESGTYGRFDPA